MLKYHLKNWLPYNAENKAAVIMNGPKGMALFLSLILKSKSIILVIPPNNTEITRVSKDSFQPRNKPMGIKIFTSPIPIAPSFLYMARPMSATV